MVLYFQVNKEVNSVEILFDKDGLNLLRNIITKKWHDPTKRENNLYDLDHEHLTSAEWGGEELTPEFTSIDALSIQSVKMVYLGGEAEKLLS